MVQEEIGTFKSKCNNPSKKMKKRIKEEKGTLKKEETEKCIKSKRAKWAKWIREMGNRNWVQMCTKWDWKSGSQSQASYK